MSTQIFSYFFNHTFNILVILISKVAATRAQLAEVTDNKIQTLRLADSSQRQKSQLQREVEIESAFFGNVLVIPAGSSIFSRFISEQ